MAKTVKKPLKAAQKKAAKAAAPAAKKATPAVEREARNKPAVKAAASTKANATPSANTTNFEIEQDAHWPATTRAVRELLYPFGSLEVGQSFFIGASVERDLYASEKEADTAQREELSRIANRMSGAVRRFTKRNGDAGRFSVKSLQDPTKGFGVRVKRVE